MNHAILEGLHEDDREAMINDGLDQCTAWADQSFVGGMCLMLARSLKELMNDLMQEMREELREEFESKIRALTEEIRNLKAGNVRHESRITQLESRITQGETRQVSSDKRILEAEKSCAGNRRHVHSLDEQIGKMKRGE